MSDSPRSVFILSGAYDDQYLQTRRDNPVICTSAGKRVILYQAIEKAFGSPVVLLSPQPKGREDPESLPPIDSRFGGQLQLFSKASGVRKIRLLLDIVHYARHVERHTRTGDVLIIDNYELIYILAIQYCRLLGRKNPIYLDYEDGKHLIDKGIWKWMSGLAEWMGRGLIKGAMLATPTLGERLPTGIPKVLVPGILRDGVVPNPPPPKGEYIRFLYSGSLDFERGIPLLLDYLEQGMFISATAFHITGQGHFVDRFLGLQKRHPDVIHFHGSVSEEELACIRKRCHYGLNLQSSAHPISRVTYPSKTFDYLNAGLRVISTKAAGVEQILGNTAIYLEEDTPAGLTLVIQKAVESLNSPPEFEQDGVTRLFTFDGTVKRLIPLFQ